MKAIFISFILLYSSGVFSQDVIKAGDEIKAKKLNESINHIGDVKNSLLTETEFQSLHGSCWVQMRGQSIVGSDLATHTGGRLNSLPDARNKFLRNADGSSSSSLGASQGQDWKGFTMTNTVQNGYGYSHGPVYMGKSTSSYIGNIFVGAWSAPAAGIGLVWDSSEIRPENLSVNMFIKINHDCD